jgi:hypothetical protein
MENLVTIQHTKRYDELRKRVDALESGNPVTAVDREQAESLRQVIERLEALEQLLAKRTKV